MKVANLIALIATRADADVVFALPCDLNPMELLPGDITSDPDTNTVRICIRPDIDPVLKALINWLLYVARYVDASDIADHITEHFDGSDIAKHIAEEEVREALRAAAINKGGTIGKND